MADTISRHHPIEGRVFGGNGVTLELVEPLERFSVRADDKAIPGLGKVLGTDLPTTPGTSGSHEEVHALWIGPDEWLVLAPDQSGLETRLNAVKSGLYSVVAINHRNIAITISGANAANTLNGGCPRDLSLDAFPVGCCSRTILGKAEIVLWRRSEDVFHIECWRSFSDYVWKFLAEAARCA